MDLENKISNRAPTRLTKIALGLLIFFESVVFAIVPFLNPITFELDEKNLTWLRMVLALTLALLASLLVNIHLTNRLHAISVWVDKHEWVPPK